MTVHDLGLLVLGFIVLLFVLDVAARLLFGPDPDLAAAARGGWSPETSCGRATCVSHRINPR